MPSLPIDLPGKTKLFEVVDPLPCAMLRFGLPCGNDAYLALLCLLPGGYHRLIAVCQLCIDDQPKDVDWIGQLTAFEVL